MTIALLIAHQGITNRGLLSFPSTHPQACDMDIIESCTQLVVRTTLRIKIRQYQLRNYCLKAMTVVELQSDDQYIIPIINLCKCPLDGSGGQREPSLYYYRNNLSEFIGEFYISISDG